MRKPTVIVIDGDVGARAFAVRRISKLANVLEAGDGVAALGLMQTTPVDLIIVDIEMPNMDGLDLIRWVRRHPILTHTPIIVLTSDDSRMALESSLEAGATSFLLKPLNWSRFGEHIRHILELAYRAGQLALHDSLTGLPNRALLNERIEYALTHVRRGELVAIHILDLDHFKNINDVLGHPIGDKLLQTVGDRLRTIVRDIDTIARMGGDEFAIVQVGVSRMTDIGALAHRIVALINEPYDLAGHQVMVNTSIGIAVAPTDGLSTEQLMRSADLALYQAKGGGRGTFCFFEPGMDEQMRERLSMERDLRKALAAEELELYYQPIVRLANNQISGFEALIRWHHPEKGLLLPDDFIPLAEEIGLIVSIGEWVIKEACAQASQWPSDLMIAVNVSPGQFRDPGLLQVVVGALETSGLAAHRLELEITETALLGVSQLTLSMLHQLRDLGVQIVNDDFGTGYSSLGRLQRFPFDKIKIDRAFVDNITENPGSLNIVRAVIELANGFGIAATAEGVETQQQLDSISSEGCTQMQGFLFSKPLPAHRIPSLLLSQAAKCKPASAEAAA
jgi:diguanylate cyclase (GGDEF)-like protein